MNVYLLKLELYYTKLLKHVLLHYSELYQIITKYYYNLILQYIILLLHFILLFVTAYYEEYQCKEVATKEVNSTESRAV